MDSTVLYFHGFKSSSDSSKARQFKNFVADNTRNTKVIIPDLKDDFRMAFKQIKYLIKESGSNIHFVGSSLGGYYASFFANKNKCKCVLINPAIPPLKDFDIYLGENENYDTKKKFLIKKDDIEFLRSKKYIKNHQNMLILVESGDEVLDFHKCVSFYKGCFIDVFFGGDHSFVSFNSKLLKISKFLDLN